MQILDRGIQVDPLYFATYFVFQKLDIVCLFHYLSVCSFSSFLSFFIIKSMDHKHVFLIRK